MSRRLLSSAVCLALTCTPSPSLAAAPSSSQVDAIFKDYARKDSPGCALAVIRDGRIVYSKGYGMASLEHGVPISPTTVFDIGSTSKQITAASILLLAADGRLSLDDDVRKYVPEVPDYGTKVTINHLLHHTSGLRDYSNLMFFAGFDLADVTKDNDGLAAIARQKNLNFPPGSEHSYSNTGYFLMSRIVQKVSGKSLRDFAQERIFTPLGMTSTQFLNDHQLVIPHRATAYTPGMEGGFVVEMSNWEQMGDGGVQTTVEDLAKWDQNFYTPKLGGARLIEELQTVGTLNDGKKLTYARGLQVGPYRGLRRVSHGGGWAGYRAELMRFPDQKLSTVVLCNLGSTNPSGLAQSVADLYLGDQLQAETRPLPAAKPEAPPATPPVPTASIVGLYWSPSAGFLRRIHDNGGKLLYDRGQGNESELAASGGNRFEMVGAPIPTQVVFLASGQMEVASAGIDPIVFQKVEPANLKPEDLGAYVGSYWSEETDTAYDVVTEGDRLIVHRKRGPVYPLEPAFVDAFQSPGGLLHFTRDPQNKIDGFLTSAGSARNLRFDKKP